MSKFSITLLLAIFSLSCFSVEQVNVYSFRKAELINPLVEAFSKDTGIKVNVVIGKADALMQRLIEDGSDSAADVLLTADVARLETAKNSNLLQPIDSKIVIDNVPVSRRDPEQHWVGLSLRARAIFYSKDNVEAKDLVSYQTLTNKKYKGRVCVRAGKHFYNRSLVAGLIYHHGEEWTEQWVKGFVANFASRPTGGDRDQIRNIAQGKCDIALANSYYYGILSASERQIDRTSYDKVGISFPGVKGNGTHVNISGAALIRSSKNKANAIKFIEYLTTKEVQKLYANSNYEYPIRSDVTPSKLLQQWGPFKMDEASLLKLSQYHDAAAKIIEKYGW